MIGVNLILGVLETHKALKGEQHHYPMPMVKFLVI